MEKKFNIVVGEDGTVNSRMRFWKNLKSNPERKFDSRWMTISMQSGFYRG